MANHRNIIYLLIMMYFRQLANLSVACIALLFCGCETTENTTNQVAEAAARSYELIFIEGDVVGIEFPGAPSLNTQQTIRRDGKISLTMVGEVSVAGETPTQVEKKLLELYGDQIVTKEVTVKVITSNFTIYVNGAVMSPGKQQSNRALTAMDAIMEAGGFDFTRANAKAVVITRRENGKYVNYKLDLKAVLEGKDSEMFYLRPFDIVNVPEKLTIW